MLEDDEDDDEGVEDLEGGGDCSGMVSSFTMAGFGVLCWDILLVVEFVTPFIFVQDVLGMFQSFFGFP